jgi:ATP-dependent DNA ligase
VLSSAGVVGKGQAFYAEAVARGQEGVMAKQLVSAYRPARRSAAWRKIKPSPA